MELRIIVDKNDPRLASIKRRGEIMDGEYLETVREIVDRVRREGDKALFEYTLKFDRYDPGSSGAEVTDEEFESAFSSLDDSLKKAMEKAVSNIRSFHEKQLEKTWLWENSEGDILGQKITPLQKVGVYAPGGKASYFSSVMMNVIPAVAAGVEKIYVAAPCPGGEVNPAVLAAAKMSGASGVFKIGGAQAIAALAYGTESVPKVDKITGPGNIYVATAKKLVFGAVDIDMIAGPSEILIIADSSADPELIAADMLAQCEHDELASAVCLTPDASLGEAVERALENGLAALPKRAIAESSLRKFSAIVRTADLDEACGIANEIAPEHLELMIDSPLEYLPKIKNAGAVFLGSCSPEAAGDYMAGPNHVLPTGGSARFFSPLGTYDFFKRTSIIYYSEKGIERDTPFIADLARAENLEGHARSVEARIKK